MQALVARIGLSTGGAGGTRGDEPGAGNDGPALPAGVVKERRAGRARVVTGGADEAAGARAAGRLLDGPALPEALLCFNDHAAVGALMELRRCGVRVPQDLAVTGYDGIPVASAFDLTTVEQDARARGGRRAGPGGQDRSVHGWGRRDTRRRARRRTARPCPPASSRSGGQGGPGS